MLKLKAFSHGTNPGTIEFDNCHRESTPDETSPPG